MKKICLLVISLCVFGFAEAQERVINRGIINHRDGDGTTAPDRPNSSFGIKGGLNYARFRGDEGNAFKNLESASSFHAGAYSQFSLGRYFSIQPEVLYSRRQGKTDDGSLRFDYFDVPVLAVLNLTETISVHAGPQVGVMMSAKKDDKEVETSNLNSFDYGGAAGLEARVSIFRLGARYYMSLADIGKYGNTATLQERAYNDLKTGNFQVYLGLGF